MTDFPEEGLSFTLLNDPSVAALVGDRVYPQRIPKQPFDNTILPAVVFNKVAGSQDYTHDGPSGLAEPHFMVTCFTDGDPTRNPGGYLQCLQLERVVRKALGSLTHAWDQLDAAVMVTGSKDRFEPESQTHQRVLTVMVYHQEVN